MGKTWNIGLLCGFNYASLPVLQSLHDFNKKVIITETLKHTEDKLFEVPHKSKEENLQDTVDDLQNMLIKKLCYKLTLTTLEHKQ